MTTLSRCSALSKMATLILPVRNAAGFLEGNISHLRWTLEACFETVNIVVIESDSLDSTVELGKSLENRQLISVFTSLGKLEDRYLERTERIAVARNTGLEISKRRWSPEFYVFADSDRINESLTAEGVKSCFQYKDWAGFVANQYGRYYDIWALRHESWCPHDCWQDYQRLAPKFGDEYARWIAVGAKQIHIDPNLKPIPVRSAFGGFGIYRTEVCQHSSWVGKTAQGEPVCEWIAFNETVSGSIYINPLMRNTGPSEHYVSAPISMLR